MATGTKKRNYFLEGLSAIIVAIIISLLLMLLAAFLIKTLTIDEKYMTIINQVIKGLSIFVGCLFCLKLPNNGWLRGFLVGLLYVILAFFIFSALNNKLEFGLSLLNDVALGAVSGLISGIFSTLVRKDKYAIA